MKKKCVFLLLLLVALYIVTGCVGPAPKLPEPTNAPVETREPVPTDEPPVVTPSPTVPVPSPTVPVPSPTVTPDVFENKGSMWISPVDQVVSIEDSFEVSININTDGEIIAAYGLFIDYNNDVIGLDNSIGDNGVVAGADGFVAATNNDGSGRLSITGFDVSGKRGDALELVKISWKALSKGSSDLALSVNTATNDKYEYYFKNKDNIDSAMVTVE